MLMSPKNVLLRRFRKARVGSLRKQTRKARADSRQKRARGQIASKHNTAKHKIASLEPAPQTPSVPDTEEIHINPRLEELITSLSDDERPAT